MCILISLPSWVSLPPYYPTPLMSSQSTGLSSLSYIASCSCFYDAISKNLMYIFKMIYMYVLEWCIFAKTLALPLEWHHQAWRVLKIEFPQILIQGSSTDGPPPPWLCQGRSGDHEVRRAHQPEEDGGQVQGLQDHVSAPCRPSTWLGWPHADGQVGGRAQKHSRDFHYKTKSE